MAKNYEMVFVKTKRIIREAENEYDAANIAKQNCPEGYEVKEVEQIKSREHWRHVRGKIASQTDTMILQEQRILS